MFIVVFTFITALLISCYLSLFFFNDTATTEIYTLSLHDALPIFLEPPDLWDRELEPRFRDRPMGIRRDAEGLEYLEIAGRPSKMVRRNLPQGLGAMDLIGGIPAPPGRGRTGLGYLDKAGLGGGDATERLERLRRESLDL